MKKMLFFFLLLTTTLAAWAGRTETIKVFSPSMKRNIDVTVTYPTNNKKACPVVYLLPGACGNNNSWVEIKPNLADIADSLHMIFVTPSVNNSWYFDSPQHKDVRFETFMSSELIQYIDSHYRTIADRMHRAITGLSMGGHGALHTALRHKDVFGAAGSTSGGVDIRPFPQNWNIKDELGEMAANKQVWDEHTVVNNISRIENGDLALIIDCGEADFFLEVNKDLHKRLLGRGIDHDFITRPGAHNKQYWANSIDYQLLFFKKFFSK